MKSEWDARTSLVTPVLIQVIHYKLFQSSYFALSIKSTKLMKYLFLFLLSVLAFITSCKTVIQPEYPDLEVRTKKFTPEKSTLNLPVEISIAHLEKIINNSFGGYIYEDDSYTDNDNDGIKMKVKKIKSITLSVSKNIIQYTVPINLWTSIKKDAYISDFIGETSFDAELVFETAIDITNRWKLVTKTKATSHQLLSNPVIKVGIISVPIGTLVNELFEEYLPEVSETIDESFKESIDLRALIYETYKEVQIPTLVNEEYETYITMNPSKFILQPFYANQKNIYINMGIEGVVGMVCGDKPTYSVNRTLPNLSKSNYLHPSFNVSLASNLGYKSLTTSLNNSFKNYKYVYKKKVIIIDSMSVFPNGDKLAIHVKFSGTARGDLYFAGIPKYDYETRELFIDHFEFDIKSKKAALNAAEWLVKGPFKKKVENMMRFSIDDQIVYAQQAIDESFSDSSIAEDTYMEMTIADIKPKDIFTTKSYLTIIFDLEGKAKIKYGKN